MRARAVLPALLIFAVVAGGLAVPAQAAPTKFEGTLAFPAPIGDALSGDEWNEIVCPEAGDLDGTFYKFIDLKADFTNFKLEGPPRIVTDPSGTTKSGDYDLDVYVFDAKCNLIGEGITSGPTEKVDTKKPGRFVFVYYYMGVHPDLPYTLQAANERIK